MTADPSAFQGAARRIRPFHGFHGGFTIAFRLYWICRSTEQEEATMNLPKILDGRPAVAVDILHSTSLTVLGALQGEGLVAGTELAYGYEDLPHLDELAGLLRDAARFWHGELKIATDFAVLSRGFVHAFLCGLETAGQIHRQDGDGLRLPVSLAGIFDGKRRLEVSAPLAQAAVEAVAKLENAFVSVQNQLLVPIASSRNQEMLYDTFACTCLWAALAGTDSGADRLEEA